MSDATPAMPATTTTATTTTTTTATGDTDRRPWGRWLLTGLCWFLALEFVVGGAAKFLPGETWFGRPFDERFVEWGYPAWFRFVVGAGEIVGGVLLVTRRRFLGAALLVVILTGATITHIVNQDPLSDASSAPFHLVLALVVLWASRPTDRSPAAG